MYTKEEVIEKINNKTSLKHFPEYWDDEDVLFAEIKRNAETFNDYPAAQKSKKIVMYLLAIKRDISGMSQVLKDDTGFCLEVFKENMSALRHFSEKVRFDPLIIDKVKSQLKYFPEYHEYFYQHEKEFFENEVRNDVDLFKRLRTPLRVIKELILIHYENPKSNAYSVDYIGLPDVIKNDPDIVREFLSKINGRPIYYNNTVKKVGLQIKNNDVFQKFLEKFSGVYTIEIIEVLKKNKEFKKDITKILEGVNVNEVKDFTSIIKEYRLWKVINEQSKVDKKEDRVKKKI